MKKSLVPCVKFIFALLAVIWLALAFPVKAQATDWYVDNQAPGNNTGTSWTNAWRSLGSISWGSIRPGDSIYISGGSGSKTYNETLNLNASGNSVNFITITVGANSPNPSGHDGNVIIERINTGGKQYVQINGLSGSDRLLKIYNLSSSEAILVNSSSYVYIDYLTVEHPNGRGAKVDGSNHCRIRGCHFNTGNVSNGAQTDNIYVQFGHDNIIESNILIQANNGSSHNDCFQSANSETRLIVRNNWMEWIYGRGNDVSQTFIIERSSDWVYVYNNVILGCSEQPSQTALFDTANPDGKYYVWNNTIVAQNPSGAALKFIDNNSDDMDMVGEVKNNIIYSQEGTAFVAFKPFTTSKMDYNCLYGNTLSTLPGVNANGINGVNPNYNPSNEYRLNPDSPCINQGADLSNYFNNDRDGNSRPAGAAWDIGAYEYGGTATSPTPASCQADLDGDQQVNQRDFRQVLAHWGQNRSEAEDLKTDGKINGLDLTVVISNWGPCP